MSCCLRAVCQVTEELAGQLREIFQEHHRRSARIVTVSIQGNKVAGWVEVLGRLVEECLNARRERFVRMVDQHIPGADGAEDVRALVVVARLERDSGRGKVRFVLELGPVQAAQAE